MTVTFHNNQRKKRIAFSILLSVFLSLSFSIKTYAQSEEPDSIAPRSLEELIEELDSIVTPPAITVFGLPKVFTGYRYVEPQRAFLLKDSLNFAALFRNDTISESRTTGYEWLENLGRSLNRQLDIEYQTIVNAPSQRHYDYRALPVPPTMPKEDYSYNAFLKRQHLNVNVNSAVFVEPEIEKKHWLHVFNVGLQFSQAFLSRNWYQGGNNYLSLLGNLFWDVQLNQVFHPNMMFQSTLSYKLGLNSTENNELHKYSISEDLFQYNLKAGYKAAHHWYYSFTLQFKTQMLNNYPSDSMVRTASFLTPANLTLGLGMTYTKENAAKTISFNASISPLSYNLKTAIDPMVDHTQFGIPQDAKTLSEFGSTAEVIFNWRLRDNIFYKTRLFLFTDYRESNADWQNTIEFQFNRFFSTQLYLNLRYDSTADKTIDPRWNRWMLKEILSVGLSYTFSTK